MRKIFTKKTLCIVLLSLFISAFSYGQKETFTYKDSWGDPGMTLKSSKTTGVGVNFSIQNFSLDDITIGKEVLKTIEIYGNFLPNNEGAPDLPCYAKYIALPNGATAELEIVNFRKEVIKNVDLAPAPDIPFVVEEEPTTYEKDESIYSETAFYPENPFILSKKSTIRGVEIVTLGITPFQYNPITKELIVYRDIEIKVNFKGGNGEFGNERLRNRWFDPILESTIMNYETLPDVDYNKKYSTKATGYEYLIIVPNNADFIAWADTIKEFRTLQGIKTGVVTISDIGSNTVSSIKSYIDNAYNNWDIPPAAVLILADYGTSGNGITSQSYSHPYSGTYITDNYYADVVNSDGLPDIAFARMTAQNATHLQTMVTKFINYEKNPPTGSNFYDNPITACGWQTERWFQLCSEIVGGYLREELGKNPIRINAVYSGTPGSTWSTATNTTTVVNYFGPSGLGYIPSSPSTLGGWTGGDAADVVNALNNGAFMLQHRDHGAYYGWGEPDFQSADINSLTNTDLSFIFSLNCLTGQFDYSSECFAEKFHRYTYNGNNAGALGLIAATQVSYSFVNDAFAWGMYDYMWPDFMPGYNSTDLNQTPATLLPGFANVSGKYFLAQSSWPYNSGDKNITYNLFHLHGDAFTMLYSEVPQNLNVAHANQIPAGQTTFSVTSDAGSYIALTTNGEILGTAVGTGSAVSIPIPGLAAGTNLNVTVTRQNYYRYSTTVPVTGTVTTPVADFSANVTTVSEGESVIFTDLSTNGPTSWSWSFAGGTPSTSTNQNPTVVYNTAGTYQVSLTATNSAGSDTETKTGYITVNPITCQNLPYTQSFENTFGNWVQEAGDDMDWTVHTGSTPSSSTGPSGAADGNYYIYMEASSPNYPSKNAVLTSSCFDLSGASNPSLKFQYHMYGATMGTLNIQISTNGTSWTTIWTKSGDQGNSWHQEDVSLASYAGQSNVTFRLNGTTGSSYTSDICIDDLKIEASAVPAPVADFSADVTTITEGESVNFTDLSTNNPTSWSWSFTGGTPSSSSTQNPTVTYNTAGTYQVSLTATNAGGSDTETKTGYITVNEPTACLNLPYVQGFENTIGNWVQSTGDDMDWTLRTGSTPSSGTGPSGAAVGSYYIYMEASSPNYPSKNAIITSPCFDFSGASNPTLKFQYHMYGATMGTLNIQVSTNGTSWTTVWTKSGDQGNSWHQEDVSLASYAGYSDVLIRLNGTTGSSYTGDICIDDFRVEEISVPAPVADFTADITTIEEGQSVNFTDLSTNNPTSWSWSFAGGTPSGSSAQNPTVTYNTAGTYQVSLTATNAGGSDTETKTGYITVNEPPACQSIPYTQGFENTIGNWVQSSADDMDWTLRTGSTPSSGTGPSGAAVGSYYIYMEASSPNYPSKNAVITSPCFDLSGASNPSLSFQYHMYGASMGSLNIQVSTNGTNWTTEWTMSGDQGNIWKTASVDLASYAGYSNVMIRLNGTTGSSYTSDICIDDLKITEDFVVAPVANFSASTTTINEGQSVSFTDLSTNGPTSWSWSFAGGTPSTSSAQNPTITYNTAGTYQVSLTASNSAGSDTETKTAYITVNSGPLVYCSSQGNNYSYEYIGSVQIGSYTNTSAGSNYSDYTSEIIPMVTGGNSVTLTPVFPSSTYDEVWRVWIDFNVDGDFDDPGEEVFSPAASSSAVSGTITIPSGFSGQTRMRISMKWNGVPTPCESFSYGEVEDYTVSIGSDIDVFGSNNEDIKTEPIPKTFYVYPNPAEHIVNVEISGYGKNIHAMIIDANGRIVSEFLISNMVHEINLDQLNSGIYLIVIEGETEIETKRFIKK